MTPEAQTEKCMEAWTRGSPSAHSVHRSIKGFIAAAITEAVEAEREACAKLAEEKCDSLTAEADGESLTASQALYGQADAGRSIADAIRARGGEMLK